MSNIGLWLANGHPTHKELMLSWSPSWVMTFYSYMGWNEIPRYKKENPNVNVVIRFQHPGNWLDDIAVSATNSANELITKWENDEILRNLAPYFDVMNEPNLHYECGDADPSNQWKYQTKIHYQNITEWFSTFMAIVNSKHPEIKVLTPAMAYGHNEDGDPDDNGTQKLGWAGYDYLAPIIKKYNLILNTHFYWGDSSGSHQNWLFDKVESTWHAFRWQRVIKMFEKNYGFTPKILITEAGNFAPQDPNFFEQIKYFSEKTLSNPAILGIIYFLWDDPTNSPGNTINSWVKNIADLPTFVNKLNSIKPEKDDNIMMLPDYNLFNQFDPTVLDENLRVHAQDSDSRITGSVARIIPADVVEKHWGNNNPIKDGDLYWKITHASLIPEAQAANRQNINVNFYDEDGVPATPAQCWFAYPSNRLTNDNWVGKFKNGGGGNGEPFTYPTGSGQIAQGKNGFAPQMGTEELGGYIVGGLGYPSEVIAGFGMTGNRHIEYVVKFQLKKWNDNEQTDPTPTDPPAQSDECTSVLGKLLTQLVKSLFC